MKKIKIILVCMLLICMNLSSCPNNCYGHGVCSGNVCKCEESGFDPLYTGSDCSKRVCPRGISFSIIPENTNSGGNGGNGGNRIRLLSNSSSSAGVDRSEVTVRVLEDVNGIEVIKDLKMEYSKEIIGYYVCYDLLNSYIGKMKVLGKNEKSNEYYIESEFEEEIERIEMNEIICKYKHGLKDLSLYYTSTIEKECNTGTADSCQLIWKGMKEVIENSGYKFETVGTEYPFLCEGVDNTVKFTQSVVENDIIFGNTAAGSGVGLKAGTKCRLLAEINNNKVITPLTDGAESSCDYCTQPKLGEKIGETEYYQITNLPTEIAFTSGNKYGIFEVYNKYSDDYFGRCSIYHSSSDNYYIKYDFVINIESNEYMDFKYELIEEHDDISLLYSSKIGSGCKIDGETATCPITWNNMKNILGIADSGSGLTFACENKDGEITEYGGWSYTDDSVNIAFTIDTTSNAIPSEGDVCNLLGKVSGDKLAPLADLKNSLYYLKKNEEKPIQFKKVDGYDNIYSSSDIKFSKGSTGSILLCNNGIRDIELILFHEEVVETKNVIYVSNNNKETLFGNYKCKVVKLLNDYSLINPIAVTSDCKIDPDKCDLVWKGMSIAGLTSNINLACEDKTGFVSIYEYQYTNPSARRRSLDGVTDITLTPKEPASKDAIPKENDICHVLLDKDKSTPVKLSASEYVKEIGSVILNPPIEIDERNKDSKVYKVVNYNLNIPVDSYIGKLYCELGNGVNGNGYLMGVDKDDDNNKYILFDFEYKEIPKVNDYNCILIESYNDLSLFNEVKVLDQDGGVCYKGKCDIIMKGMNDLLSKVNLGSDVEGSDTIDGIAPVNGDKPVQYIVCRDRVKNVKLYKYTATVSNEVNITFSLVDSEVLYPKVGDYCSLLSKLDGNEIKENDIYESLYKSNYYKMNNEYKYPPLLDYDYKAGSSNQLIYRVKDLKLEDKSFSVGLLKCYEGGVYKGIGVVYGIKDDYTYIKYEFLGSDEPIPSNYDYVILNKYNDLSLLLGSETKSCTDSTGSTSCTITLTGMKSLITELYPSIMNSETKIKFVCGDKSDYEITMNSGSSVDDNVVYTIKGTDLTANVNCYMLNNFDSSTIEKLESSDYGKLPKLESSTEIAKIDEVKIYSVLSMNELVENGLGEVECYDRTDISKKITGIYYGKSKSNPKLNYIVFKEGSASNDNPPVSNYYDCNVTKIYNDYSSYPKITTTDADGNRCADSKCVLTWTGMSKLIEGVGLKDKPLQFKCSKDNDDIYIKLTTDKDASTSTESASGVAAGDLTLYLSKEDASIETLPSTGYLCSLFVYSNGSNINHEVLPTIVSAVDSTKFIYEVSNVNFKSVKGIGYKECKVNGESKRLLFMGKKNDNRYIKFEKAMTKGPFLLECDEKETILNDLSNYYEIEIPADGSCSSPCSLTLKGMYPLLQSVGFFNSEGESKTGLSLACMKEGESDYTVYSGFSTAKGGNDNDFVLAGGVTIDGNNKCHLLSTFKGEVVKDSESDFAKSLIFSADKSFGGKNLVKMKNLIIEELDNMKIGELKCANKDNNIPVGTAYLMGYKEGEGYYIDYSFTSNPTPYNYECNKQKQYNDLSLLYEIEYEGENKIDLTPISDILPSNINTEADKKVVCKNSLTSKLNVYTATYADYALTITSSKPPTIKDKCYLLIKSDGKTVTLKDSDYGKFNGIKSDEPTDEVVVKVDTSAVAVKKEEVEIPKEIESNTNALIKCYDKENKEYLGEAEILGKNEKDELIIKYYFGNADGSKIEPSLLEIVPTIVRKDYSMTQTPKIENNCSGRQCVTIWSEIKLVLNNLFSSSSSSMRLLRNLNEVNCINGIGLNKNLEELNIEICSNENNNDLSVILIDNIRMSEGDKIYPSLNSNGIIPAKSCEAYQLLKNGDGGITFEKEVIEKMNEIHKFLFKNPAFDTRQLYPGNTISMNVQVAGQRDAVPTVYTITGVERNYVYVAPTPRLLNENVRMLDDIIYDYAVDVSEWNTLQESDQNSITLSFPSTTNGNSGRLLECSGVGICDRENGICKCYEGFSGSACERMSCNKNCNNHGKCVRMKELLKESPSNIFGEDEGKIYGCLCDAGYRGVDCSLKECPSSVNDGDKNDRDCSNNGICDYSNGVCNCFDGYYGEACQYSVGTA